MTETEKIRRSDRRWSRVQAATLVLLFVLAIQSIVTDYQQDNKAAEQQKQYNLAVCEQSNELRRNLAGLAVDLGSDVVDVAKVVARFPLVDCQAELEASTK